MTIYENREAMTRWIESPQGRLFLEWAQGILDHSQHLLESSSEMPVTFHNQGAVKAWKKVLGFKSELKFKPVVKVA